MCELAQYDYELPRHLIAQSPAICRTDARLLVVDRARNSLENKHVRDLPEFLRPDDCLVINFANGDMVGHTGNLPAAVLAVETVDECVGRVVDAVLNKGGALIVTADHGNCEQMIDPDTGCPHTAHTTYEVQLILVDERSRGRTLRHGGRLADIAPTLLEMLGLSKPDAMTGRSLLKA